MSEFSDILKEFLVESAESLDQLDRELVALESEPHNREILKSVFRKVHTIKGTCGFFELKKLESITHVGETLLDGLRSGTLELNQDRTTVLLQLFDATRQILGELEARGNEGEKNYDLLVADLQRLSVEASAQDAEKQSQEAAPQVLVPTTTADSENF